MLESTAGKQSRTTAPMTSSSLITSVPWKSGSKFNTNTQSESSSVYALMETLNVRPFLFRQCALAALRDVKSYLKDEGGQVAVSFPSCMINFSKTVLMWDMIISLMFWRSGFMFLSGLRCHKHDKRKARDDTQVRCWKQLQGKCPYGDLVS